MRLSTLGTRGSRVSIHVRRDRGNRLYFQWPRREPSESGARGGYNKVASSLIWPNNRRDQRSVENEAEVRAAMISDALRAGQPTARVEALALGLDAASIAREEPTPPKSAPTTITLRDVFLHAIGPSPRGIPPRKRILRREFWAANPPSPRGIYVSWTLQARTARALADQIEDRLGADRAFLEITANDTRSLWETGVADNAMKRVSVLLRASRWAEREYRVSHGYRALALAHGWQGKVAAACRPVAKRVSREKRYSVPEAGRLWRVFYDPASPIHPVLRDAVLLGGEHRLGQVINTTLANTVNVSSAWAFKPPEQERKQTAWLIVPFRHFERFREILDAAARRQDQRLFPLSRGPLLKAWRHAEELAGVPHFGWYGMRRAMVDLCDLARTELLRDAEDPLDVVSEVVLDAISGHRSRDQRGWYRDSPVGVRTAPMQPSGMWTVMVCAMRVAQRAREMALARADSPL